MLGVDCVQLKYLPGADAFEFGGALGEKLKVGGKGKVQPGWGEGKLKGSGQLDGVSVGVGDAVGDAVATPDRVAVFPNGPPVAFKPQFGIR